MAVRSVIENRRLGQCRCFGYAYVVRRPDGLFKIGMTASLHERLKAISQGAVAPVSVVTVTPRRNALALERRLQSAVREQRVQGDWFRLDDDHLERIAAMCDAEDAPEHTGLCAEQASESISGEVVDQSFAGNGVWLTPPQAAAQLGMSERTLWRRIDAGKFKKRVVSGRAQVYVPVAGTLPDTQEAEGTAEETREITPAAPDKPDIVALALIEEFKERRQQDADTIARLTTRLTELERENAVLHERALSWVERWRRWWHGDRHA